MSSIHSFAASNRSLRRNPPAEEAGSTDLGTHVLGGALNLVVGTAVMGSMAALPALAVGATAGVANYAILAALPMPKDTALRQVFGLGVCVGTAGTAAWALSKLGWISATTFKAAALGTLVGCGITLGACVVGMGIIACVAVAAASQGRTAFA